MTNHLTSVYSKTCHLRSLAIEILCTSEFCADKSLCWVTTYQTRPATTRFCTQSAIHLDYTTRYRIVGLSKLWTTRMQAIRAYSTCIPLISTQHVVCFQFQLFWSRMTSTSNLCYKITCILRQVWAVPRVAVNESFYCMLMNFTGSALTWNEVFFRNFFP